MATYKGIGFDTANGRTRTGTSSDDISFDAQITATDAISVTAGGINVVDGVSTDTLSTTGDASVGGDLTVTGDIISRGEVNLVVEDPFIDLGVGNSTTSAEASGFTFSMNRNSGFTAETITAATAGVASPASAPTLTSSTNPTQFAAGDLLVLTGSDNNNGIFVVNSISGGTITLKGTGGTAIDGAVPFAQSNVETETSQTATAYKVDIKVLLIADGSANFTDSGGSTYSQGTLVETFQTNATESDFTSDGDYTEVGAASSLQTAYNTGATITTASTTDIAFTLSSGDFTVDSGSIDFGGTSALSTFNVDTSGAITLDSSGGGLSLDGAAASNFTTSSGALTLDGNGGVNIAGNAAEIDLTTTGALDLNSGAFTLDASTASIDSTDTTNITMTANDVGAKVFTIDASNSGGGTGTLTLTADDTINVNATGTASTVIGNSGSNDVTIDSAGVVSIDSADNSNFTVAGANLSLGTTTSGELDLTSAGLLDVNAGANLDIDVTGSFDVLASTTFSIDGTGASNVTATSGNLTVSTATSGNLVLSSAGNIDADAADVTVDATAGISLDSATSSNFTLTANNASDQTLTIEASNSNGSADGNILINADGTQLQIGGVQKVDLNSTRMQVSGITELDASSGQGLRFGNSGNLVDSILDEDDMASDDVNALATQQSIKAYVDSFGQPNYLSLLELTADATGVAARDVIAIDSSGNATKADADAIATCNVVGFALNTASSGNSVLIAQVGILGGFSGLSAGSKYYASTTAGGVTTTPPSGAGDVVFQVGFAASATQLVIQPMFVMEIG